ncbi:MAG: DUF2953 domain-containing protein [Clostridia bacterium]|nr:DUF2953 domain-containing protein [Clostridia bacterium]
MLALKIILGIILFFILILSVKVRVTVHSEDGIDLNVRWLFLKFRILPKKEKGKKKKKKKPKKEDETVSEPKPPKEKKKGDNIFVCFYKNNGVEGVVDLLKRLAEVLKTGFGNVARSFTIEELYISLLVGAGDSAATADKYGKTCAAVFPAMGVITSKLKVKKYSIDVNPDFIYGGNNARVHAQLSVVPRRLINSFIGMGVRLVFKVVIKFLRGTKAKKPEAQKEENKNSN